MLIGAAANISNVPWGGCDFAGLGSPFQCVNISVPLDYTNDLVGTIKLAVVKYPATHSPRMGTMFVNIGGPGISIFETIREYPEISRDLQVQIGNEWDVVSWEPRGVSYSEPRLRMFDNEEEESAFWNTSYASGGFYTHPPLWSEEDIDTFMGLESARDTLTITLDNILVSRNGDNLKYIGTTANARDLATLASLIDGPGGEVNFYGYSYGTLLGLIFTQLYPSRVGKIILDALVDPTAMSTQSYLTWGDTLADTEATWKGFNEACALAGTVKCPFARPGDNAGTVDRRFERMIRQIDARFDGTYDPSDTVLYNVRNELYWPRYWYWLATYLNCLYHIFSSETTDEQSTKRKKEAPESWKRKILYQRTFIPRRPKARKEPYDWAASCSITPRDSDFPISLSIFCGDTPPPNGETTNDVFNEIVRVSTTVSRKFGALDDQSHWCHQYSSRAVERYSGPWNNTLSNVVLVIGNEADPITPYRNARLVASEGYLGKNSRLVRRWDFGHTSGSENSPCIDDTIYAYTHGILPADREDDNADFVCNTEQSILGLDPGRHFNPETKDGDTYASGAAGTIGTSILVLLISTLPLLLMTA